MYTYIYIYACVYIYIYTRTTRALRARLGSSRFRPLPVSQLRADAYAHMQRQELPTNCSNIG